MPPSLALGALYHRASLQGKSKNDQMMQPMKSDMLDKAAPSPSAFELDMGICSEASYTSPRAAVAGTGLLPLLYGNNGKRAPSFGKMGAKTPGDLGAGWRSRSRDGELMKRMMASEWKARAIGITEAGIPLHGA